MLTGPEVNSGQQKQVRQPLFNAEAAHPDSKSPFSNSIIRHYGRTALAFLVALVAPSVVANVVSSEQTPVTPTARIQVASSPMPSQRPYQIGAVEILSQKPAAIQATETIINLQVTAMAVSADGTELYATFKPEGKEGSVQSIARLDCGSSSNPDPEDCNLKEIGKADFEATSITAGGADSLTVVVGGKPKDKDTGIIQYTTNANKGSVEWKTIIESSGTIVSTAMADNSVLYAIGNPVAGGYPTGLKKLNLTTGEVTGLTICSTCTNWGLPGELTTVSADTLIAAVSADPHLGVKIESFDPSTGLLSTKEVSPELGFIQGKVISRFDLDSQTLTLHASTPFSQGDPALGNNPDAVVSTDHTAKYNLSGSIKSLSLIEDVSNQPATYKYENGWVNGVGIGISTVNFKTGEVFWGTYTKNRNPVTKYVQFAAYIESAKDHSIFTKDGWMVSQGDNDMVLGGWQEVVTKGSNTFLAASLERYIETRIPGGETGDIIIPVYKDGGLFLINVDARSGSWHRVSSTTSVSNTSSYRVSLPLVANK